MVETLYYFINVARGISGQVKVETTTPIGNICEKEDLRGRHCPLCPLYCADLIKPSNLSRKPVDNLLQHVAEWPLGDALDIGDEVGEIFETGLDRNLIHIAIVPQPMGSPYVSDGRPEMRLKRQKLSNSSESQGSQVDTVPLELGMVYMHTDVYYIIQLSV